MTIFECSELLLAHFSPEERTIPDNPDFPGRNAAVLEALNGALQECYGSASPWLRWDERGAILRAPTPITLSVTADSDEAEVSAGWADWMAGCTVVIDGHDVDNQIRNDANPVRLKYPYDGPSGTVAATVYHDCLLLPEDVLAVHGPVTIDGREILPRPNSMIYGISDEDYGFHTDTGLMQANRALRASVSMGTPVAYVVETWTGDVFAGPRIRIRLAPANGARGTLDYRAMLRPPSIGDIASLETPPVPHAFIQTIFMPIARQKLMASPFWREQSGGEEIRRAHTEAIELLEELHPSKDTGITLKARF
jgi:hypothetical protein